MWGVARGLLGRVPGKARCPCILFGVILTLIRACSISLGGSLHSRAALCGSAKSSLPIHTARASAKAPTIMANPPLQTPPVRVRVLNVCGEGKARPSGRNPQAEAKSPPEKLADKTVQPLARQIATATISKTAAHPLSVNMATLENPKWFPATIPVEER